MTARSEDRGVQVEARTLSGVHIGWEVEVPAQWAAETPDRWRGELNHVYHQAERTTVRLWHYPPSCERPFVQTYYLAPTDLVTLTDGGA
ncbi:MULTISPECIES: hypothetical protein [unclassified Aeromicrobium]|uniref:hypothetical protein n=1 Tax=unclassified Aeromicrobium TaxID=2633570 RepID=UPI0028892019|nr:MULTISPECIES: hypothetical protein [unclassified Aeromicrobium]